MRATLAAPALLAVLLGIALVASADAPTLTSPLGRVVHPTSIHVPVPPLPPAPEGGLDALLLDGAGTELRDQASGGPSASKFVHLESETVCGAPCRVAAANDEVIAIAPAAGDADFPWRWASSLATLGVAGGTYSQATVWLDTNGHVAFQDPVVSHPVRSTSVPNVAAPNAIVAANWQDLDPSATSGVPGLYVAITGTAPNRVIYIEWWNVPNALDSACTQQFEIALYESGYAAEVYYLTSCTTFAATAGEESSGGAVGLLYFNGAPPQNAGVRYRDVRAPGGGTRAVVCDVPGSNGWCITNDLDITFGDSDDRYTTQIGTGVKSRVYRIGTGPWTPYSRNVPIPLTVTEGLHTPAITVTDWAGNVASATWTNAIGVDQTPPSATAGSTCTIPGGSGWCRGTVNLAGTSADSLSGIWSRTCRMDGATRGCTGAYTTQGTHAWRVDTSDRAGWTASASSTIKLDSVAPATTVTPTCSAPGENGWCRGEIALAGAATDATSGIATVSCELDGAPAPCATTVAAEGTHTFRVTATDVAGNTASTTTTVKIDSIAPAASAALACASEVAGICVAAPLGYEGAGADDGSGLAGVDCLADGVAAACTGEFVEDGAHELAVTVTDAAGNVATAAASMTLDTGAPVVGIDLVCLTPGNAGWCRDPSVGYAASASDATSGVASLACEVDGVAADCAGDVVGEGAHTVAATAADAAGHSASTTADTAIDSVPPEIAATLTGPAGDNGWHLGATDVALSCSDATSGVAALEASVDGGEFAAYTEPITVSDEGATDVVARCTDVAGHVTESTTTVRIDTVAPDGALANPAYAAGPYQVAWNASDATSGVAVVTVEEMLLFGALGDSYAAACTTPADGAPEASGACDRDPMPGVWCYRLRVRDVAGHEYVTLRASPDNLEGLAGELGKCTLKATPSELPEAAATTVGVRAPDKSFA